MCGKKRQKSNVKTHFYLQNKLCFHWIIEWSDRNMKLHCSLFICMMNRGFGKRRSDSFGVGLTRDNKSWHFDLQKEHEYVKKEILDCIRGRHL